MEIEKKSKEARANAGLTQEQVLRKLWFQGKPYQIGKMEFPIVKEAVLNQFV